MWRSRGKSTVRIHNNFSCSSFKDIQLLCADDYSESDPLRQPTPSPSNKPSVFHRIRRATYVLRAFSTRPPALPVPVPVPLPEPAPYESLPPPPSTDNAVEKSEPSISIPEAEKRIVVYLTSLRVVRSTFDDCRSVQSILQGFRVKIDERDLSMDSAFQVELQRILGHYEKTRVTLPRIFIGGRYIGGAEEVMQLHETGELKKLVQGLPAAEKGVCEVCGGYRFILCDECSGSHKCYTEKGGFRSCTACNENGLIRCPSCSCASLSTV